MQESGWNVWVWHKCSCETRTWNWNFQLLHIRNKVVYPCCVTIFPLDFKQHTTASKQSLQSQNTASGGLKMTSEAVETRPIIFNIKSYPCMPKAWSYSIQGMAGHSGQTHKQILLCFISIDIYTYTYMYIHNYTYTLSWMLVFHLVLTKVLYSSKLQSIAVIDWQQRNKQIHTGQIELIPTESTWTWITRQLLVWIRIP